MNSTRLDVFPDMALNAIADVSIAINKANRLLMKQVSLSQIRQYNRLFNRDRCLAFSLGKDCFTLKFIPTGKNQFRQMKASLRVDERLSYNLSLEKDFLAGILNDYPNMGELQKMPPGLRAIALEIALERLLDQFDRQCNCRSTILALALENAAGNLGFELHYELRRQKDGACFQGSIETNHEGMVWMLEKLDQLPANCHRSWDHIPLNVCFEAGYAILPIRELAGIAPNDIILLDSNLSPGKSKMIIRVGPSLAFCGCLDPSGKIIVEKGLRQNMEEKLAKEINMLEDKFDPRIGEIPVQVVFQVGETRMTFGELVAIQPGYTFELGADLKKPVTIKANGQTIGMGEMVQIGDRIGIRVLQFEERCSVEPA